MSEMGLDLTRDYPKPLTDDVVRASDVVITMLLHDPSSEKEESNA